MPHLSCFNAPSPRLNFCEGVFKGLRSKVDPLAAPADRRLLHFRYNNSNAPPVSCSVAKFDMRMPLYQVDISTEGARLNALTLASALICPCAFFSLSIDVTGVRE
jgi:hypothetical protein